MVPMMFYLEMIPVDEDKSKFEKIYEEYRGVMYRVAYQILSGNEFDSEDAVHSAFVKVAENIEKLDGVCPKTKGYVVTVVEHKAIDILRERARHQNVEFNEETVGIHIDYTGSYDVADCLARLSARDREVLALRYRYGFSNKEIAKTMNVTEDALRKMEQRARERLLKLYKGED